MKKAIRFYWKNREVFICMTVLLLGVIVGIAVSEAFVTLIINIITK